MADPTIPHFKNDDGVPAISIGVKKFKCMGAAAPFDHPHIFLDMGDENEVICPYCSTLYRYDGSLKPEETKPAGAFVRSFEIAS